MINNKRLTVPNTLAVDITAAASASNGITQASNVQNNFGTSNMAIRFKGSVPDWTPAANVILHHKRDGTNGTILTLLTTGILRTTINGTNYDSTVATGMTDNYVAVIDVDITVATTTAAGSVVYTLNGVQLGATLAISARVEEITNGTFDSDITGWTLATGSGGSIAWSSGKMRVTRVSATSAIQAITLAAGETLFVSCVATLVSGATTVPFLLIRNGAGAGDPALVSAQLSAGASGTLKISYYSATAQTVYLNLVAGVANGTYDFDTVTSLDSATVDNTSSLYVCGTSAVRSASQWFSHRLFNRAKTVAENLSMFVNGMAAADVGASQTAVYTSDFSAGVDSWVTASSTTAAGNIDGIGGKDNNLRATTNGTANARVVRTFSAAQFLKNNRLIIEMYRPSANVTCTQVDVRLTVGTSNTGTVSLGDYALTADAWTTLSIEIPFSLVTNSATAISLYFADAAGSTSNNTNGDILYLASSGRLIQTGITSELLGANARNDTLTVTDSSGNSNNATLPAAGATVVLARK